MLTKPKLAQSSESYSSSSYPSTHNCNSYYRFGKTQERKQRLKLKYKGDHIPETQERRAESRKSRTNLHTKDGVERIHSDLVLGSVTDESFSISERDIGGRGPITLIISNNLNTIMLPNSNTRVSGTEIDTDGRTFSLSRH